MWLCIVMQHNTSATSLASAVISQFLTHQCRSNKYNWSDINDSIEWCHHKFSYRFIANDKMWKSQSTKCYMRHKWSERGIIHLSVMDLPLVLLGYCKASLCWHVFIFILEQIQRRDIYALLRLSVSVLDFTVSVTTHTLPLMPNCLEKHEVEQLLHYNLQLDKPFLSFFALFCWSCLENKMQFKFTAILNILVATRVTGSKQGGTKSSLEVISVIFFQI